MPIHAAKIFETDEQKWVAVCANDKRADGHFWYGVTSTGIVCNPSCPSRAPLRQNVNFFDDLSAAEQQGFRRCKRCRP